MSRSIGEHVRCPDGSLVNNRFKVVREIGCGNFAKVYKCIDQQHPTATPVAVKILKKEYAADAAFEADILRALNAKDSRGHKVVRLLDQFTWSRCPCFVFALRGTSLRSRKMGVARGHLTNDDLRKFTKQMIETLAFLHHDVRMVHTDLKPENILIDDEDLSPNAPGIGTGWTICDFGSASFYNPAKPDQDLISTRPYRSPEVVLSMPWSTKADIWSMACIMFELYYGARLFEVNEDAEHLGLVEKRVGKMPLAFTRQSKNFRRFFDANGALMKTSGGYSARTTSTTAQCLGSRHISEVVTDPDLRDLLMRMLDVDPSRRISAQDILRHPFLTGVPTSSSTPLAAYAPLTTESINAQMDRLSLDPLGAAKQYPRSSVPSSAASSGVAVAAPASRYLPPTLDKENASAMPSKKISPAVPSFAAAPSSHAAFAGAAYAAYPASARSASGGYELPSSRAAQPMLTRDIPVAGKPSSGYTPRYAVAAPPRW